MAKLTAKEALQKGRTLAREANARRRQKEDRANMTRKVSGLVGAYALGYLNKPGEDGKPRIEMIPELFGSRLTTVAVLGLAVGEYGGKAGMIADVAEGVGEAAAHVALYQYGSGAEDVAGGDLADGLRDQLPGWGGEDEADGIV